MGAVSFDPRNPKSLSAWFRSRRDNMLRDFVALKRVSVAGPFRILDMGGTADYWKRVGFDWLEDQNVRVTCLNCTATEFGESAHPHLTQLVGDATSVPELANNSFDLVHSNSVVEHVGLWPEMRAFATEVRRLAPSYFVQTPYYWFPIDPHFFRIPMYHWLPVSLRAKLHMRVKIGHRGPMPDLDAAMAAVLSNHMLDLAQFRALFPDATHQFETIAGLPKSLLALR